MNQFLLDYLTYPSQGKVLVVGDVMLDEFIYGAVDRISPEAPIPVMKVNKCVSMLGGAGNVVRNIAAQGVKCHVIALGGMDLACDVVIKLLNDIDVTHTIFQTLQPTIIKQRFVGNNQQQMLRADHETLIPIDHNLEGHILTVIENEIRDCDLVVLSDYMKGVLTDKICRRTIELATTYGKPVIVDTKRTNWSVFFNAYLMTPNKKELLAALQNGYMFDLQDQTQKLLKEFDIHNCLVTLGSEGMALVTPEKMTKHPTLAKQVFDVSGAGDTVIATIAACLVNRFDLDDAVSVANIAAGIVVSKKGTATVSKKEILLHFDDGDKYKFVDLEEAEATVNLWKEQHLVVGMTNGIFDLIHPGHVTSLSQAKRRCDKLVVALNSDASTKRLKGDARPLQDQYSRAQVMAALRDVDLVLIFDGDTPVEVIEHLLPNKLFKGADYTVDQVAGGDIVIANGGVVELLTLSEGHSTTNLVNKLNDNS